MKKLARVLRALAVTAALFGFTALSAPALVHMKPEIYPHAIKALVHEAKPILEPEPKAVTVDWRLILLNPWSPMPDDYSFTLKSIGGGHSVDERIEHDLMRMLNDCRADGLSPVVRSSYRSTASQQKVFTNMVNSYLERGFSQAESEQKAARIVARPGTSEHQAGLALDIVDSDYQTLDPAQANTGTQKWLMENSWKYGFILRYPKGKSDVTGIIYEPWHYRYVGLEAAKEIYESGLCLEEFLERLNSL